MDKTLKGNILRVKNCKKIGNYLIILILTTIIVVSGFYSISVKADSKESTIQINAGYLRNKEDNVELSEGVKIIKGDINLSSPRGTMQREERKLILSEGVKMNYNQGNIESRKMTGWFNDDRYLFEKKVTFDYKPQDKEKTGFVLKAPYLEINPDTESFNAKNGVTINYQKKLIKAQTAEYLEEKGQLVLKQNVFIQEENGDWVRSKKAVFDLSTGEEVFTADGDVEIEINLNQANNGNNNSE